MFYEIRYQTGEIEAIIKELKSKKIPSLEVDDFEDFTNFCNRIQNHGIIFQNVLDEKVRNKIKEPEFEFRASYNDKYSNETFYIDVFMEPIPDDDYETIYGD